LAERQPEAMTGLRRPTSMTPELADQTLATRPAASVVEGVLVDLRTTDAAAFREFVADRWARLGREDKLAAFDAAAHGLSPADEGWLEDRAADPAALVSEQARSMLALLPGSRFTRALQDRAGSLMRLEGRFRPSLVVSPSEGWTDIVGLVAPAFWAAHLRTDARGVVERFASSDLAGDLIPALATATRHHGDALFAEALLGPESRDRLPFTASRLLALVAANRRGVVLRMLLDGREIAPTTALLGDVTDWTDEMAQVVLRYLARIAPSAPDAWQIGGLVRIAGARIPVRFADDLETVVAPIRQAPAVSSAMETLAARVELHQAFAGSTSPTLDPTSTMEATQ
jgi:hypothetical protein